MMTRISHCSVRAKSRAQMRGEFPRPPPPAQLHNGHSDTKLRQGPRSPGAQEAVSGAAASEAWAGRYLLQQAKIGEKTQDANTLLCISRAIDRFTVEAPGADGQPCLAAGLARARQPALVIGVQSDILFPVWQQREVAQALRAAGNRHVVYYELDSVHGHSAFLHEADQMGPAILGHLSQGAAFPRIQDPLSPGSRTRSPQDPGHSHRCLKGTVAETEHVAPSQVARSGPLLAGDSADRASPGTALDPLVQRCLFRCADAGVLRQQLRFDEAAAKNRPVSKVITLLKDMLKQLEKEAEEDEEIYDKMACWCETNDKEKTKAIADAEARIADLTSQIEEATALSARLSTEIKNLEKEVAKNQEALDKATAIRQKELAEFNAEEKDLLESISALKAAVTVLSKHHGSSAAMLQAPKAQLASVVGKLRSALEKHRQLLIGAFSPSERRAIDAFLQAPGDYFDASPTFKQSYAPQSGEIFGILKQMKETFEADLSDAQKQEMENQKAYEELKAAKQEEIAAGQAQLDTKSQELASTDEKLALAKEDIEDTKNSLAADQQFLMMLKEKCSMSDK
ncbi:unnamed protein product, partial [Prorocentrum cordatum]